MEISTRAGLMAWFEEQGWFDDGHLFGFTPQPTASPPPEVRLELGYPVSRGLDPRDEVILRVFQLTATGVTHFSIGWPGYVSHHYIEIEVDDDGLGFTIDTPGLLHLAFDRIEVIRLDDRHRVVEPWVSDHDIRVLAAGGRLPSADDWLAALRSMAVDARWSFCGDDGPSGHNPADKQYVGWCLQLRESGVLEEVVFLGCREGEQAGYSMSIDRRARRDGCGTQCDESQCMTQQQWFDAAT